MATWGIRADPFGRAYDYRVTITGAPRGAVYLCGEAEWQGGALILSRVASSISAPNELPIGKLVIPLQWPATAAIDYIGEP